MTKEKPHLSYSALSMLWRCGIQYEFRYIKGIKRPPGVFLIVGKGLDMSVTSNLQSKKDTGLLLPVEQVKDTARDAVVHEWDHGGVSLDAEERQLGIKQVKADAIDKAVRLSVLHADELAPKLEPTQLQRKWRLTLKNFPFDLTGITDIEESTTVRDTKMRSKSPAKSEVDASPQLTAYALAKKVIDGQAPQKVFLDCAVDTKRPMLTIQESTRSDEDFKMFLRRLENAAEIIQKGAFTPIEPTSFWCSERLCGFWAFCPYARRPTSVFIGDTEETWAKPK